MKPFAAGAHIWPRVLQRSDESSRDVDVRSITVIAPSQTGLRNPGIDVEHQL